MRAPWCLVLRDGGARLRVELDAQVHRHEADTLEPGRAVVAATEPACFQQWLEGPRDLRRGQERPDAPVQPVSEHHGVLPRAIGVESLRLDDALLVEHG